MENIPIATNIESQQPESSNQLQAINVHPYSNTFQAVYVIDIDTQNTIESQSIEQDQESNQESNQQFMRRKTICLIKLIGPIILAIIVIIGIYYNFTTSN